MLCSTPLGIERNAWLATRVAVAAFSNLRLSYRVHGRPQWQWQPSSLVCYRTLVRLGCRARGICSIPLQAPITSDSSLFCSRCQRCEQLLSCQEASDTALTNPCCTLPSGANSNHVSAPAGPDISLGAAHGARPRGERGPRGRHPRRLRRQAPGAPRLDYGRRRGRRVPRGRAQGRRQDRAILPRRGVLDDDVAARRRPRRIGGAWHARHCLEPPGLRRVVEDDRRLARKSRVPAARRRGPGPAVDSDDCCRFHGRIVCVAVRSGTRPVQNSWLRDGGGPAVAT